MARTATNEGRCCDAVLRILEEQHGVMRADVQRDSPEQPGIELTCVIGDQRYAVEHTLIEPFPDNQRDNIAFERVLDDDLFSEELCELLRPDLAYNLYVDVYAFRDRDRRALESARAQLLAWARDALRKLPLPPTSGPPQTSVEGMPPDAPVRVVLACRRSAPPGGRIRSGRFAPPLLDALRRERLLKALEDKGPKLHAARRAGTRTVLIAENHDIALTNASKVGEVFDELATQVSHMPDDIYIVDAGTGDFYHVTQVRCDGRACLSYGREAGHWEFAANRLDNI